MKIAVLMYTFNGSAYIDEQVKSIIDQDIAGKAELKLFVRDDGSSDNKQSILDTYQSDGKLTWYTGEKIGSTRSYWELMDKAGEADYYAFAEQDDFWLPEKLSRAVKYIETKAIIEGKETEVADGPMLYCGECTVTDLKLKPIGFKSNPANKYNDFEHSVVFSSRPGCTYVFNSAALKVFKRYDVNNLAAPEYEDLARNIMHIAGTVIFDRVPSVYRRKNKVKPSYKGGFFGWYGINKELKNASGKEKSGMAKSLMEAFPDELKNTKKLDVLKQVGYYIADSSERGNILLNSKFATGSYMDNWFIKAINTNKL